MLWVATLPTSFVQGGKFEFSSGGDKARPVIQSMCVAGPFLMIGAGQKRCHRPGSVFPGQ